MTDPIESQQPACTICGKGPFPTLRNWAQHDCTPTPSDTPRTDAVVQIVGDGIGAYVVSAGFARQLERELNATVKDYDSVNAELAASREQVKVLRGEVQHAITVIDDLSDCGGGVALCELCSWQATLAIESLNKALDATEEKQDGK